MFHCDLILPALLASFPGDDLREDNRGSVRVKTDLPREEIEVVYELLEDTRVRVQQLLDELGLSRKSEGLTRMRMYATLEGFESRKLRTRDSYSHWASAYFDRANNEIVTWWHHGSPRGRQILRHELTHQVLREYVKNPPIWFNEGLACYIGGIRRDEHGDPVATLDAGRLRTIRQAIDSDRACPLYELMDLPYLEFYGRTGTKELPWDRSIVYAQSWALVYFLLEEVDENDRPFLDAVVKRLDTGRWNQAFFRKQLPQIEPRWHAFLERDDLLQLDELTQKAREKMGEQQPEEARKAAEEALKLDPQRRAARRVLAEAHRSMAQYEEALAAFDLLIQSHQKDAEAHLGRAQVLLLLARAKQDQERAELAQEAAEQATTCLGVEEQHRGLLLASEAAEFCGDLKGALKLLRQTLALDSLPKGLRADLQKQEQQLVRRSIGKG